MSYLFAILIFFAGLLVGSFIFADSKPRSPLSIHINKNGWDVNQIAGLLASVVIKKTPGLIPNVIVETDKTIVFKHPRPKHKIHYMFVPKKDIKNIGDLTYEDMEYIVDLFALVAATINKLELADYRLWTNGPEKQDVAYLHFHLGAD